MKKQKIDELIFRAYHILNDVGIVKDGKIDSAWRAQISSFGAFIAHGSLLAAVSVFSAEGNAKVDRSKLMDAIAKLLGLNKPLFKYVEEADRKVKESVLDAAIALKLAMNLYDLGKRESKNDNIKKD